MIWCIIIFFLLVSLLGKTDRIINMIIKNHNVALSDPLGSAETSMTYYPCTMIMTITTSWLYLSELWPKEAGILMENEQWLFFPNLCTASCYKLQSWLQSRISGDIEYGPLSLPGCRAEPSGLSGTWWTRKYSESGERGAVRENHFCFLEMEVQKNIVLKE